MAELQLERPIALAHAVEAFLGAVQRSRDLVAHVKRDDREHDDSEHRHEQNRDREQIWECQKRRHPFPRDKIVELVQVPIVEEVEHQGEEHRVRPPDGQQCSDQPVLEGLVDDVLSFVERRAGDVTCGPSLVAHWMTSRDRALSLMLSKSVQ